MQTGQTVELLHGEERPDMASCWRMAVAVIGDVGGRLDHLQHALHALGVEGEEWPHELHVVQLGDLFGGRDDVEIASLVEPFIEDGHWTQLVGNWELEAVGGKRIVNSAGLTAAPEALAMFRRWHEAGSVNVAAAVASSTGTTAVVTHAGITAGFWSTYLEASRDAQQVVTTLNQLDVSAFAAEGEMTGETLGPPGPLWATTNELWSSWMDLPVPFPQIHGHSSAHNGNDWNIWVDDGLVTYARREDRHVHFTPPVEGSAAIIGIDPGLWDGSPAGSLQPLVL